MKQLFLAMVVLASAAAVHGQTGVDGPLLPDTFDIGTRKVRVPPPEGFSRIGLLYDHILSVQMAAEPPQNEIFALHLPTNVLPKYRSDFDRAPDFFTKVSVSRAGKSEDVTPAGFDALQTFVEKEFARLTDPDGKEMVTGQRHVSKSLSELLERSYKVKWERPINLGVFDKSDRIHSTLTLLSLSANNKPFKFLGTVSFVYVNMRLIYVYAYKADPVESDIEMLREFVKKWTASIVASNEELIANSRK
jgi:hypothetical protein